MFSFLCFARKHVVKQLQLKVSANIKIISYFFRHRRIMSFIIRKLMKFAMYIFYIAVKPYSIYFSFSIKPKKIPPISNNIIKISGTKLAHMIRNQEVKCEDVIRAYVERCKEVNPFLNAVVEGKISFYLKSC